MAYIGKEPASGIRNRFSYTATAGQTTFSGSDDESRTLSYTDGHFTDVFLNGVKLDKSDYTATSGTSIVLDEGAVVDDILEVLAFDTFSVFSGDFSADVTVGGTLTASGDATITGDLTVDTDTLYVDSANNRVGVGTTLPDSALHVKTASAKPYVFIEGTSTADAGIRFNYNNGTFEPAIFADASALRFYDFTAGTERMRIDSSGNVGIGTTSPMDINGVTFSSGNHLHHTSSTHARFVASGGSSGQLILNDTGASTDQKAKFIMSDGGVLKFGQTSDAGSNTERMRIDSSGIVLFGTTDTDPADNSTAAGLTIGQTTGRLLCAVPSAEVAEFNRGGSDGTVIVIRNSGSFVGSISVSGGTTSYNAFSGSHWGRLADNSKPTILRGTVIESIGTMIDWYQVEFDVDIDGETVTKRRNIAKPANVEDGDTFNYVVSDDDATPSVPAGTYTGTLRLEDDEKHPHVKISDTSESKAVYGVFTAWDNDDDTVNDMYVTAVGTGVVRILSTETVAIGDLLDSNGDGTAKVQSDDIIRSRTIGKVLSTVKQETYSDGSYTVPCALYCG